MAQALQPLHCRTLQPADGKPPCRVLFFLHGGLVTGDDLLAEAEVLRAILSSTTIVLPEGPVLADTERGLRLWWVDEEEAKHFEHRDLERRSLQTTIQELLATIRHFLGQFPETPTLLLAGFSQGARLLSYAIASIAAAGLKPKGLAILSGLVEGFDLPAGVTCRAFHGDEDEVVNVEVARSVAQTMAPRGLVLEELPGLAHKVSDAELEKLAAFLNEDLGLVAAQAKLLRYIKRMSEGLAMYDKDWFMRTIVNLKMVGLTESSPSLGDGAVRYFVHQASETRGLVLLFHGMVADLLADTRALAEAYVKQLRVAVCIVDYRQRVSTIGLDAQLVLESLNQLGCADEPVILHGVGFGSSIAIHIAMASQAMPLATQRRLRLLVLDGAMGAIHTNVGCTTKDPIGNDSKLAYVRLPLCVLGGDDKLCGLTVGESQWVQISELASDLHHSGKVSSLWMSTDPALEHGSKGLHGTLVQAVEAVLQAPAPEGVVSKDFMTEVLDVSEGFSQERPQDDFPPWTPLRGVSPKAQLEQICTEALSRAQKMEAADTGAWLHSDPEQEAAVARMLAAIGPSLTAHGGFQVGVVGLRQLVSAVTSVCEFHPELLPLFGRLDKALDLSMLALVPKERLAALDAGFIGGAVSSAKVMALTSQESVPVVIKHITKGGSLTVTVPAKATILDVRKAVMAALREDNLLKVKLVIQVERGTRIINDAEPLDGRTELCMVGRALQ